jgi:hypothetical protein
VLSGELAAYTATNKTLFNQLEYSKALISFANLDAPILQSVLPPIKLLLIALTGLKQKISAN